MPPRADLTVPARSTRSASRGKASAAAGQSSRLSKQPARASSTVKGSADRALHGRIGKPTDSRSASGSRSRSRHARIANPRPAVDLTDFNPDDDDDEEEEHDVEETEVSQQQQPQGQPMAPPPWTQQAGGWLWMPAGQAPPAQMPFQQAQPSFPQYGQPHAETLGITSESEALNTLYRDRHEVSFEGVSSGTFLSEHRNIRTKFPSIKKHWFAAIWKGDMDHSGLEKMALEYNSYGAAPQGEENASERKYRLLFTGIEIYSIILCHFNPGRRLQLYEAFATYRAHLLELLISCTLDSVTHYHHIFVGRAMAHGQDRPEHWAIHNADRTGSTLRPRPDVSASSTTRSAPAATSPSKLREQSCWNWNEDKCTLDAFKCRRSHICFNCKGNHKARDCSRLQQGGMRPSSPNAMPVRQPRNR